MEGPQTPGARGSNPPGPGAAPALGAGLLVIRAALLAAALPVVALVGFLVVFEGLLPGLHVLEAALPIGVAEVLRPVADQQFRRFAVVVGVEGQDQHLGRNRLVGNR